MENLIENSTTNKVLTCFEPTIFQTFQKKADYLLLIASTNATVFNIIIIFCAMKLLKRSGDTMHIFIINMTLGDLLLTAFSYPNEALIRKHVFSPHLYFCTTIHFFILLGLATSGLSLTLLNIDKLIYFRWPLSYNRLMSKRGAILLCYLIWFTSLSYIFYMYYFKFAYATEKCSLQISVSIYYQAFMIIYCIVPVISSLFVSIYLFLYIRQKLSSTLLREGQNIPTYKFKVKSLVFIFATTVWTSFSLLPYRIFNITRIYLLNFETLTCDEKRIFGFVAWILMYLLTLNPLINSLLTTFVYAPYRLIIKNMLITWKRKALNIFRHN